MTKNFILKDKIMKKLFLLAFLASFLFAASENNESCGCADNLKSQDEINKFFGLDKGADDGAKAKK